MDEIKETGGAMIGLANATWPLASLTVGRNMMQLRASLAGNLVFKPSDIVSIEPYSYFLQKGVKINHKVDNYNKKVAFWYRGNAIELIHKIKQTGFLDNKAIPADVEFQIIASQSNGSYPIKKTAAIALTAIWNVLFVGGFIAYFKIKYLQPDIFIGPQLALGFAFLTCLLLFISEPFRRIILKPGVTTDDIKTTLYFLMFILAFIFIGFLLFPKAAIKLP